MIPLLNKNELDNIRKAGAVLRECMEILSKRTTEGTSTKELEVAADDFITSRDACLAFHGYKGFPASICTSRNNVVVHGIPSEKEILKNGDIISIDIGVEYKGYFADAAKTFAVGEISGEARRLVSVAEGALSKGIEMARAGNHVQDISWAVQSFVESNGFNVVRAFVGHGIGRKIHEEPEVPNFGEPHKGKVLEAGMALAIEPMVNAGTSAVKILDDGWTAVTTDGELSAHFEHTVVIAGGRVEIVT
ncbi:MAG: type I methionyl aminopeptidase [Candidatus Omnitrophica bacterium]|nr:type I methionyl aminopeptidase [Candidatus Omnitrophota bacterium]